MVYSRDHFDSCVIHTALIVLLENHISNNIIGAITGSAGRTLQQRKRGSWILSPVSCRCSNTPYWLYWDSSNSNSSPNNSHPEAPDSTVAGATAIPLVPPGTRHHMAIVGPTGGANIPLKIASLGPPITTSVLPLRPSVVVALVIVHPPDGVGMQDHQSR